MKSGLEEEGKIPWTFASLFLRFFQDFFCPVLRFESLTQDGTKEGALEISAAQDDVLPRRKKWKKKKEKQF